MSSAPRRTWSLLCLVLLAACGTAGEQPEPAAAGAAALPEPELSGADRTVQEAVALAREAVLAAPDSGDAWGRLGMVLEAHGLHAEARRCYERAAALQPRAARWPYLIGDVAALRRAAELEPGSALIHTALGDALVREGDVGEAVTAYRAALEIDPDTRPALLGLAELALRDGAAEQAIALLEHAANLDFCDREVHAKLARAWRRGGDPVRAEHEAMLVRAYPELAPAPDPIRAAVVREAASASAFQERGMRALARGRTAEAVGAFRAALELRPDSVRNHLNLGGALLQQGQTDAALKHFRDALAIAPEDAEVHNNLAVSLMETGDLDAAAEHLQRALELDPDHDEAHLNTGILHEKHGAALNAIASYRRALDASPVNVDAHLRLARLLEIGGEIDEAIEHWRAALDYGCHHREAALRLGMTLARRGRFGEAALSLRRGLRSAPADTALLAALATILATCPDVQHRDGPEAVRLAERLVAQHGPEYVPSLNLLAAGQAEAGDFEAAVRTSRRALEIARRDGNRQLAAAITARLSLYESGRPYHQR